MFGLIMLASVVFFVCAIMIVGYNAFQWDFINEDILWFSTMVSLLTMIFLLFTYLLINIFG